MKELGGKVAIVTAASKGIGARIARHLAAEGASVVVNYVCSKRGADEIAAAILKEAGRAIVIQADVANSADVKRLFAAAKDAFGRLDVLVNNAGVFEFGPLEQVTEASFHKQLNANVLGTLLATQEAAEASVFGS